MTTLDELHNKQKKIYDHMDKLKNALIRTFMVYNNALTEQYSTNREFNILISNMNSFTIDYNEIMSEYEMYKLKYLLMRRNLNDSIVNLNDIINTQMHHLHNIIERLNETAIIYFNEFNNSELIELILIGKYL